MSDAIGLKSRFSQFLDFATAETVSDLLIQSQTAETVEELLEELNGLSTKIEQAAIEALPALHARGGLREVVPWLDAVIALAESSGATALKYLKESPVLMGLLQESAVQRRTLGIVLELAEQDPNVAMEFFRASPELVRMIPHEEIARWAEIGLELCRIDFVVGIEFLRQCHAVAAVLPLDQVRDWVALGMKLITQNSLGKTDYLGTVEFFRTSPAILGDIEGRVIRVEVVSLGNLLAEGAPQVAIAFLAQAPSMVRGLPSQEWAYRILQYAHFVAGRDREAALLYLKQCPDILSLIGNASEATSTFERWFKSGMEILEYSPEGGRAYFSLETRKALASIEEAMSGVPLRHIARALKLFVQGLCGVDVSIQPLPDHAEQGGASREPSRVTVSKDGWTILLPTLLRQRSLQEDNRRLYMIMAAHEAGHLEFGTYTLQLQALDDLSIQVAERYERTVQESTLGSGSAQLQSSSFDRVQSLQEFFQLYPQPRLMRDLWTVLEDARVEYHLQRNYPGLKKDLVEFAREAMTTRSLSHGMSIREMVVDALLILTTVGKEEAPIPESIQDVVYDVWAITQTIFHPNASSEDSVRVADRIYVHLEQNIGTFSSQVESGTDAPPSSGFGPGASEELSDDYRSLTNFSYRGTMNPDMISREQGESEEYVEEPSRDEAQDQISSSMMESPTLRDRTGAEAESKPDREVERKNEEDSHPLPDSSADQLSEIHDDCRGRQASQSGGRAVFVYDEWDGVIQDYRSRWCRVSERAVPETASNFAEGVLQAHGAVIRVLRRYFQGMRPPGLRRVSAQADGDDLDLDALVTRQVDRVAGVDPTDRLYIRRERRERSVAVAFLVDVSGSTSRQLPGETRRVIDVEKEGLVILSEALEALGDSYAVYGYSGRARDQVDFMILKDFHEGGRGQFYNRLGSIAPGHQNRDGAAIRHATWKLLAQRAKVRLLIVLSDGKPLDDAYAEEYALADTKMALREARMKGVHPFCITVDREGDDYLRRMYGDVRYIVIDQVASLPERLPRVYQRLTT